MLMFFSVYKLRVHEENTKEHPFGRTNMKKAIERRRNFPVCEASQIQASNGFPLCPLLRAAGTEVISLPQAGKGSWNLSPKTMKSD